MIKLTIYGRLRKFIGQKSFEINAKSPREAFNFLIVNFQGVGDHIKEQEYCIMVGNTKITEETLDLQTQSDIKIIPIVHGEWFFLAAAFLGAGAVAAKVGILSAGILGTSLSVASALTAVGTSFLLTGVADLLTPDPPTFQEARQEDPQDPSFVFTGLINNTKQGVPINLVYGEMLIGSTIISSNIDTFVELI
jgi:predicted phage tail protein